MFENKDKDLDGRLSFEEFMGEESRAERLFKLMDKDNDGWVTKHVSGPVCVLCSPLSLVQRFMMQLSFAIKNPLGDPKHSTRVL